ncbi:DsbA family protein [Erwinia typographi]|uniref:DsbA family protein n=1 Tax=Erwinia typographi TaxID=371042 RepID=UPI00090799FB
MNKKLKMIMAGGVMLSGLAVAAEQPQGAGSAPFSPEQEDRIGELTRNYLLAHPDIIIEVEQKLQTMQQKRQIKMITEAALRYQESLLDNRETPSYGPADARVAFIEFFDYQCSVCARQAQVIEEVMKANPKVRYIFKEWPIFAPRWPTSEVAAETGLQLWQQKGMDAYLAYHNALYETGHDEGRLTQADITKAASPAGKLKGKGDDMLNVLSEIDGLAQNLGLRGTPGIIVMPVRGATPENTTVIPGGADQGTLQSAIDKASEAMDKSLPVNPQE